MPIDRIPAGNHLKHDHIDDEVDSDDEDLIAWYNEEWAEQDHIPYISGGFPAFIDSVDDPLFVGGHCIFVPRVSGGSPSFVDLVEDPLFVGGKSIFALCAGGGTPASLLDTEEEPLLVGGSSIFAEA